MTYDPDNVFAKILRGEIPNKTVYEDDQVLAFEDIGPHMPVHVLIIPKSAYTDINDFSRNATDAEIVALFRAVHKVTDKLGIAEDGYRLVSNCGGDGGQEVPHLHLHILGGGAVGPMVSKK